MNTPQYFTLRSIPFFLIFILWLYINYYLLKQARILKKPFQVELIELT